MATASVNELFDDLPPSPPPLPWVFEESGYENLNPVPPLQTQMRTNPPSGANEITNEPALKKSRTLTMRAETPLVSEAVEAGPPLREMSPPFSDTRDSEIRTKGTPSGCFKNIIPVSVYVGGEVQWNHMGATYSIPPMITFSGTQYATYKDVTDEIFKVLKLSKELFSLNIQARYNGVSTGSFFFTLLAINDDKAWRLIYEMAVSGMNWRIIELYVNLVPNQTTQNDNPDSISSHGTSMHTTPSQTMSFNYPTHAYWSRPQQVSNQACQNHNSNPTSLVGTSSVTQQSMPMHVIPSQTMPQGSCSRPIPIPRNFPSKSSRIQQNTPMHAKPSQTKPKPPLPQVSELIILEPECDNNLNPVTQSPRAVHETPDQLIKACQTDVCMNPLVSVTTDTGSTGDEQMEVYQIDTDKDDDYELIILEPECDNLNPVTQSPQAVHETPDQLIKACQPDVGMNPLLSVTTDTGPTGDEQMEVSQTDTNKDDEVVVSDIPPIEMTPPGSDMRDSETPAPPPEGEASGQPSIELGVEKQVEGRPMVEPQVEEALAQSPVVPEGGLQLQPYKALPPVVLEGTVIGEGKDFVKDYEEPMEDLNIVQYSDKPEVVVMKNTSEDSLHKDSDDSVQQYYSSKSAPHDKSADSSLGEEEFEEEETESEEKKVEYAPPGKRRRGAQPGHKKGQRIKKPRTADSCIKSRCNIDAAMHFFHMDVLPNLKPEYKTRLADTPFMHLFAFPHKTHANNPVLHSILLHWVDKEGAFVFRKKILKFTFQEVGMIMGLGIGGEAVEYKKGRLEDTSFRCRHFKRTGTLSVHMLEIAIRNALKKDTPVDDVVGLLVMYLFSMVLFPLACGNVPNHLFHYAADIDSLKEYNWAEAVHRVLVENIPNKASWCRLKRAEESKDKVQVSEEEEEEDEDEEGCQKKKKEKKESGNLPGCALALIAWFFEHITIPQNRKFTTHIPRFLDHKLSVNWRRTSFQAVLRNVNVSDIKTDDLSWEAAEEFNKQKGFVPSAYFEQMTNTAFLKKPQNMHIMKLLTEMTPVYCLFNFNVSNELVKRAAKHRFEDLNYLEDSRGVPVLSPASEHKFIAQVCNSERRYIINKRLFKSPVKDVGKVEKGISDEDKKKKRRKNKKESNCKIYKIYTDEYLLS